jgi:serine/threonine protein kinase
MAEDDPQRSDSASKVEEFPGMPAEGETFAGRYRIVRLLGKGGMGMVYLAVQAPLERLVALKVLRSPADPSMDPQFYNRFLREAEAASRLQHPNTITIYDFGKTELGVPYIVLEYLEGRDLRQVLESEWPFPLERTLHVAIQVCKSLFDAHDKGMIHRDLKPSNVLLVKRDDDENFVKVFDFGLVKFRDEDQDLTQAGVFLGSPRFTFPEALDSKAVVDHRADIYATGTLIYTMVAGQPPFSGEAMAVLSAHLHETPRPMCEVDPHARSCPALEVVVARCLRKDPAERYQSMRELQEALRSVVRSLNSGEASLELDPSSSGANWRDEFEHEERTTQRDLSTAGRRLAAKSSKRLSQALIAAVVVLLAVAAMISLRPAEPAPAPIAVPAVEPQVKLREVGVTLYSEEPDMQVSYMAGDGRWQLLGKISDELRSQWTSGSLQPWWIAEAEPDQQVLSLLLHGSEGPGRQLELPIVDGQVRFDAAQKESDEGPPQQPGGSARAQPGAAVANKPPAQAALPASPAQGTDPETDLPDPETDLPDRKAEQPSGISPEYKDNPY